MHESIESVIQADVLEPTMYDVMDQLITINNRLDSHDDLFVSFSKKFEAIDKRFESIENVLRDIQATLAVHGKLLVQLVSDKRVSAH